MGRSLTPDRLIAAAEASIAMHVDILHAKFDGTVEMVGTVRLDAQGKAAPDRALGTGFADLVVIEPGIGPVDASEGERYLRALQHSLRGTRTWATEPLDD